jgi:hypothetical protein
MSGAGSPREHERPQLPEENPKKEPAAPAPQRFGWIQALGVMLFTISVTLFVAVPVVLFLPLSTGWKVGVVAILLVVEEVVFWMAALLLGREVVRRYRRFFDPRYWLDKARH